MNPHFPLPLLLEEMPGEFGFTGKQIYKLTANFMWLNGSVAKPSNTVVVPAGFKTDLASVPGSMNAQGYKKAAVIHDYLCKEVRKGHGTYAKADRALYDAMIDDGAPKIVAKVYWAWVSARHAIVG